MHAVEVSRPKSRHAVSAQLSDMAHSKGPGAKLPTQRELCRLLGASTQTVDHALADLESKNIIYRRQGSGIYVSPKIHRKTILVLLNSTFFAAHGSPFWGMLWALFAKEAAYRASFKDEDFQFHLVTPPVAEESLIPEPIMKDIEAGKVDGVVSIGMNRFVIDWIEARGVHTVAYAGPGKWVVEAAMDEACRIGVNSLVDDGCRAIGLWAFAGFDDIDEVRETVARTRFQSALAKKELAFNPAFLAAGVSIAAAVGRRGATFQEQGYYAALHFFGNPAIPKPDGLVIEDDLMTDGAIAGLEKLGIRVGADVKIAAYTNLGSPTLFSDREKLTRIEFDPGDIPTRMLAILDEAMEGREPVPQMVLIEPTVRRNTS